MHIEQDLSSTAFQRRYGMQFPDKWLAEIYELFIPCSVIKVSYAAEQVVPVSATTEFILRFVSSGLVSLAELMQALGFSETLLRGCLADELDAGRLILMRDTNTFRLTASGEVVLAELKTIKPLRKENRVVFDKTSRRLTPQSIQDVLSRFTEDGSTRVLTTSSSSTPAKRDELKVSDLSTALRVQGFSSKKNEYRVVEIQRSRTLKNGFLKCKLLVWVNARGDNDFLIEIDGDRDVDLELTLREAGGLEPLGINPIAISQVEIDSVVAETRTLESENSEDDRAFFESLGRTQSLPDGGSVLPAEHRTIFAQSLSNCSNRLLIISPWISRWIVNSDFLTKLKNRLELGVSVTIAWGFDDTTGRHKSRSHPDAVLRLIELADAYPEQFTFVKMDQSHSKILIADDLYVCTSHNWLSYDGSSPRAEWGEKRTMPNVVDERYEEHLDFIFQHGHAATKADVPQKREFGER